MRLSKAGQAVCELVRQVVIIVGISSVLPLASFSQATSASTTTHPAPVVPSLIKFSGTLKDSSGLPLNGTIPVVFGLYIQPNDVEPVWKETQNVSFENGKYSVFLGSATSQGIPTTLFQSGEPHWLGIRIALNDEPERPRIFIATVPYAMKAGDADTLGGLPASAFLRVEAGSPESSSSDSCGYLPPVHSKLSPLARASTASSADDNWIPKFSSTSGLAESQLQDTGGEVHLKNLEHTVFANEMVGSDLGAKINAAIITLGNQGGIVLVPPGTYTNVVTTVVVKKPNISIIGAGSNATIINYTGKGDFLRIQMQPFTVTQAGSFSGFTVNLGSASISGIHIGDTIGAQLEDIVINGPSLAAGAQAGIWLDNQTAWTERTAVMRVQVNYVRKGFRFTTSGGGAQASFGYTRFLDVRANVGPNQAMISFEGGTLYNSSLTLLGNAAGGKGTTIISLTGAVQSGGPGSIWNDNWYQIQVEQTSGSGTVLFDSAPGTLLSGAGYIKGNAMSYGNVRGSVMATLPYFGVSGPLTGPSVLSHANGASPMYQGFGSNLQWNGSAYVTMPDGSFNGGAAIMNRGTSRTVWELFSMPSTSGQTPQVIQAQTLGKYKVAEFGHEGITLHRSTNIIGNLTVTGNLAKSSGSFKIDDPVDPTNKYLYHSFVESPDMMDIYNGTVITDKRGYATVLLPHYFQALNRDFRYQLTPIGSFAAATIQREISNNQFTIRTSHPRVKVSWQVTGIRHDAYADAYRVPVEEEKPVTERGHYLHPELFTNPVVTSKVPER